MSDINIEIKDNVVMVTIDGEYIGSSFIPKEYDSCDVSTFVNRVSDSIKEAICDARENMWPQNNDVYYVPDALALERYKIFGWVGNSHDEWLKAHHLIFRTRKEAIEAAEKMLEVVK